MYVIHRIDAIGEDTYFKSICCCFTEWVDEAKIDEAKVFKTKKEAKEFYQKYFLGSRRISIKKIS